MANCPLCGHKIPDRYCQRCKKVRISLNGRQLYCPDCSYEMQKLGRRIYWNRRGKFLREERKGK